MSLKVDSNPINVCPKLREYQDKLLTRAREEGLKVDLYEGYRTVQRQNSLYNQGRSRLKGEKGLHTQGFAIDIVFKNEKDKWTWDAPEKDWIKLGKIGKDLGLEWGGDWSKFIDRPHFQLKEIERVWEDPFDHSTPSTPHGRLHIPK